MSIKVKKILIIAGIILVSIIVLLLIVRGISSVVAVKKFNAAVDRMKAEGRHIEIKDFEIQCEDSENAALPWKEIEKMFSPTDEEKKLISDALNKVLDGEIFDKEEKTKIIELISKNKQCFERLKEVIEELEVYKLIFWLSRPFIKSDLSWAMEIYDESVEACKMPYYKTPEFFKYLGEKWEKIPRYYIFSLVLVPSFKSTYLKKAVLEAEILAAKAGIACKIFQNRQGGFPEQLSQLVPDILAEVPTKISSTRRTPWA